MTVPDEDDVKAEDATKTEEATPTVLEKQEAQQQEAPEGREDGGPIPEAEVNK
jgi:hypothetical protein